MTDQNHCGTQPLGQLLERREHAAQRGVAIVVESVQVSRHRVDHDQPAVAQPGGGRHDRIDIGSQAGQRLGPIRQDDRLQDVNFRPVRPAAISRGTIVRSGSSSANMRIVLPGRSGRSPPGNGSPRETAAAIASVT